MIKAGGKRPKQRPYLEENENLWDWLYIELDDYGPVKDGYVHYLCSLMDKITDIVYDKSWH